MRICFSLVSLLLLLILSNCSMNGLGNKYDEYEELHKHEGNEKHEVSTILAKDYELVHVTLNKDKKQIIIGGKTNPIKEEEKESKRLKLSINGKILAEGITNAGVLEDGTLKGYDFYSNWIINGDTTKHRYVKPFSDKDYEPEKWLLKFKEWYDRATASYYFNGTYYLKINDKWNAVDKNFNVENFNFDKHFPDKYAEVRMIELEDRSPSYVIPPEERDSSLIKQIDYESVFEKEVESAGGWSSSTYSAGWWYFQIYMPGGDTLKVKRFSSYRGPEMKLYKIPERHGGREDVLFIVLEPKDAHPEQVGGMYVIRPRALGKKDSTRRK